VTGPDDDTPAPASGAVPQPLGDLAAKVADLRARLEGAAEGPPADPDAIQDAADDAVLRARRDKALKRRKRAEVRADNKRKTETAKRRAVAQDRRTAADDLPHVERSDEAAMEDPDVARRQRRRARRVNQALRAAADDGAALELRPFGQRIEDGPSVDLRPPAKAGDAPSDGNILVFPGKSSSSGKSSNSSKAGKRKGGAKETGKKGGKGSATTATGPDPDQPRHMGFDIEAMNRDWALVLMGSKAVVYREQRDAPIEDQQRILVIDAFKAWYQNRYTEHKAADGKWKIVSWATAWLQSKKRRSYAGVEFHPLGAQERGGATPGYLNLWSGWACEPRTGPERWATLRRHMLDNVCDGDEKLFNWVFGFFAHMVQRPRERIGVALVMRGRMGAGKSIIGEIFGSLVPRHYFLVDDPRYVTGNFNAHMASCLLLQADEAVWAGDKTAEGRLKGLITSPIQQIESKGVDPIRLKNYVRLVMTSNEDWVVPAGKDERRYCVLDVKPGKAQDHGFFRQLWSEIENGGREALLADLMAFDMASVDMRVVPKTEALLEQKLRSLNSVESWWFGRLTDGRPTRDAKAWPTQVATDLLMEDYIKASERIGIKRKSSETEFGMAMRKLIPDVKRVKGWCGVSDASFRKWCLVLPDIGMARHLFEKAVQQAVDWPVDDADETTARDRFEGVEAF
jgi:hypothetical protein